MSPEQAERKTPAKRHTEGLLEELSAAIESGAGLPAVTRAAAFCLCAAIAMVATHLRNNSARASPAA